MSGHWTLRFEPAPGDELSLLLKLELFDVLVRPTHIDAQGRGSHWQAVLQDKSGKPLLFDPHWYGAPEFAQARAVKFAGEVLAVECRRITLARRNLKETVSR